MLNLELAGSEVAGEFEEAGAVDGVDILGFETVGGGVAEVAAEDVQAISQEEESPVLDEAATAEDSSEQAEPEATEPEAVESAEQPQPEQQADEPSSILDEIARAEEICKAKEAIVENLKEELKDAKADFDSAVNKLRRLASGMAKDRDRPLLKAATLERSTGDVTITLSAGDEPHSQAFDWRSVSILDLTNCDLSPAIAQRLKDSQIETIGQLEDLRAEISNGKATWPKGIGAAKITAIEEAITSWLTTNRDQIGATEHVPVSPPIAEAEGEKGGVSQEGELKPADKIAGMSKKYWKGWREWDEEKHAEKLIGWSVIIAGGPLTCQDAGYLDVWKEGFDAFNNNEKLETCGIAPDTEDLDEWVRGWLSAQAEEGKSIESEWKAESEERDQEAERVENAIAANAAPAPIPELDDDDFDL